MLRAVIFDFDGVICDSEQLHYKALNTVFNRYGVDVPKDVHWAKYLGYSDLENIEAVNRDYKMGLDTGAVRRLMMEKKEIFEELAGREFIIIGGVETFVKRLMNARIRCAICSGALRSDIELMLSGADFAKAFEVIVSADDVQYGKPHPEGYILTLKRLNQNSNSIIKPCECVVIEDSRWGLEAAAAAGMHAVAVSTTYQAEELNGKANMIVKSLDELTIDKLEVLCQQ